MVDYEKLGELIDGYGGISADDLGALPEVDDSDGASLVGSLGRENAKLRAQLCDLRLERGNYINDEMARLRADNKRLREALAEVELILTSLPSRILPAGINDGVGDVLGRWPA